MIISLAVDVLKYLRGELAHSTELWVALRIVGQFTSWLNISAFDSSFLNFIFMQL
jgi:hypothetical protein